MLQGSGSCCLDTPWRLLCHQEQCFRGTSYVVFCLLLLARRKTGFFQIQLLAVHMRPSGQFVDNLPGIALPNCLVLGTGNPQGVPRHVEFGMLLRDWSHILGFAGWCRVQQRHALKNVGMTREDCVCMQSKFMLYLGMKEKSYFREKLAWKRGSFSPADELGFCKH